MEFIQMIIMKTCAIYNVYARRHTYVRMGAHMPFGHTSLYARIHLRVCYIDIRNLEYNNVND